MLEKVYLVNINDSGRKGIEWELPLNHLHLSYSLRENGFLPEIYEVEYKYLDSLIDRIIEDNPLFIGLGAIFDNFANNNMEFLRKVKEKSSIPILIGGSSVTLSPNIYLNENLVDFVCCGEGEMPIVEFAKFLKGEVKITNVSGIGYKQRGENNYNAIWSSKKLDNIGFDFSSVKFIEEDKKKWNKYVRKDILFSMRATKGCPFKCTFCYNSLIKNRFRMFDIEKIVNAVDGLKQLCEFSSIRLIDDYLFLKKEWTFELLESLKSRDLTVHYPDARAEDITKPFMEKLRQYKVNKLFFGFESYYDNILNIYNKKTSTKILDRVLRLSNSYKDIQLNCQIIIGAPGTTIDDAKRECINYLRLLDKYSVSIFINPYKPIPGTILYEKAVEKGFEPFKTLTQLSHQNINPIEKFQDRKLSWIAKSKKEEQFFNRIHFVSIYCNKIAKSNIKFTRKILWPFISKRMLFRFRKFNLGFLWEIYLIDIIFIFKKGPKTLKSFFKRYVKLLNQ